MKFNTLTDSEIQILRDARKVLNNLVKKYTKLRESSLRESLNDKDHYRMFKELKNIKVDVDIDKYEHEESVQLSLNLGMYGYSTEVF